MHSYWWACPKVYSCVMQNRIYPFILFHSSFPLIFAKWRSWVRTAVNLQKWAEGILGSLVNHKLLHLCFGLSNPFLLPRVEQLRFFFHVKHHKINFAKGRSIEYYTFHAWAALGFLWEVSHASSPSGRYPDGPKPCFHYVRYLQHLVIYMPTKRREEPSPWQAITKPHQSRCVNLTASTGVRYLQWGPHIYSWSYRHNRWRPLPGWLMGNCCDDAALRTWANNIDV